MRFVEYLLKENPNKKVFLGGTCNKSKWRDELIDLLKIDYFNPVVDDWNEEAQKEEKKHCVALCQAQLRGHILSQHMAQSLKASEGALDAQDLFHEKH